MTKHNLLLLTQPLNQYCDAFRVLTSCAKYPPPLRVADMRAPGKPCQRANVAVAAKRAGQCNLHEQVKLRTGVATLPIGRDGHATH